MSRNRDDISQETRQFGRQLIGFYWRMRKRFRISRSWFGVPIIIIVSTIVSLFNFGKNCKFQTLVFQCNTSTIKADLTSLT